MESASATNNKANATRIQGCWKKVCACCPAAAKAAPAMV